VAQSALSLSRLGFAASRVSWRLVGAATARLTARRLDFRRGGVASGFSQGCRWWLVKHGVGSCCCCAVVAGARTVIASGAAGWFEVAGAEARRWTVAGAVVCGACAICCRWRGVAVRGGRKRCYDGA